MDKSHLDNVFLARWLNDDLSPEEKARFKQSDDYTKYLKIIDRVDTLQAPTYDKKKVFTAINHKIDEKSTVKKLMIPKWSYGIAATLLLLVGFFLFSNQSTKYSTDYGEQASFMLPDGSEVILNSKSSISFHKNKWDTNRELFLDGEAFFKVQKGATFTVATVSGSTQVLGTQFNVNSKKGFFEVTCHEGSVKVTGTNTNSTVLTKGNAFRILNDKVENWETKNQEPSWLSGESTFRNTPLKQVIQSIQNQFNITIHKGNIDENLRFTGSYNHNDIKLALKTIFVPMEISFTFKDENSVLLVK